MKKLFLSITLYVGGPLLSIFAYYFSFYGSIFFIVLGGVLFILGWYISESPDKTIKIDVLNNELEQIKNCKKIDLQFKDIKLSNGQNSISQISNNSINFSLITYYDEKLNYTFKKEINKNLLATEYMLSIQKSISIYYNTKDPSNYFFFLPSEFE